MSANRWLGLILAVYVVLGAAYAWIVPLGEAPDEIDHFLYVRHLVEQRAFPVMRPIAADNDTMEANQPPLFYLLNALVTAPFPMTASADFPLNACYTFDPHDGGRAHFYLHQPAEQTPLAADYLAFRVARWLSVLLGALTVWLAYRLGRQMVPGDARVGLLAAAALAFNPQFVFMTASVNNDVLTAVLGAALVWASVQAATKPRLRLFGWLGLLMGLALLTKFALLALWPLPFLAAALAFWRGERKTAVWGGALVAVLPLLTAGWWYARAARLYGDPLAWEVHLQAKGSEVLRTTPFTLADLREFGVIHFQSYWAWFGWLKIQAPGWVYGLLVAFTTAAAVGVILVLRDWRLETRDRKLFSVQSLISSGPVSVTAVLFNVLAVGAIYASLLRYILTINWSGYQGRLAYAAAAPVAALLGLGWYRLARGRELTRRPAVWSALPAVGLAALSVGCLLFLVRPAYARPALYTPPVDWARICRATDSGFYVEAAALPDSALPGAALPITVAGYGLADGQAAGEAALLDWDGAVLATTAVTLTWTAGNPISQTMALAVPEGTQPARGQAVLFVGGERVDLGWVKIAPLTGETAVPSNPLVANFGDQAALVGYDLQPDGADLRLRLYWQALAPMAVDYTMFAHLLRADGQLLAQHDAQPGNGRYPTTIWDSGEIVVEEVVLRVPPNAVPARIAVGLYRLDTLERLAVMGGGEGETAVFLPIP
ncbi:MAG: glycosyltransferase family 39 protein [Chloroflexi bacterium]|nr:glycosyltransferase family 39 protein [Chloroflexota bacterium]MBP7044044.1 glycosyltransferase family 39 protein [Chloroflexota bacterium]